MSSSTINSENDKPFIANSDWRRYALWYLLTLLLICALVAGINSIVDPHGRVLLVEKPGFNQVKITLQTNSRKGKSLALRQCNYDTIVIGTSRAEMSIVTDHPALSIAKPYNAAIKGASMYEMRRMAEYALRHQNLKTVLLSLDFVAFNEQLIYEEDFADSPLAERPPFASLARYLVSLLTLRESIATVRWNVQGNTVTCSDTGEHKRRIKLKAARIAFDGILRRYAKGPYKRHISGDLHLQNLTELLQRLLEANVKVYAYISPAHVTHLELMAEMNLLDDFEDWKRSVVQVFADTNRKVSNQQRAVLWDFSGYNEITTEKVPYPDDEGFMRWYSDSSHANRSVGDLMIDRMLGLPSDDSVTTTAFGLILTPENVDAVIAQARYDSERYRRENPDEIARIRKMLRSIN